MRWRSDRLMSRNGAGEQADLVEPGGEAGNVHLARAAEADAVGGDGQVAERSGDGPRQEARQEERQGDEQRHDGDDQGALVMDRAA